RQFAFVLPVGDRGAGQLQVTVTANSTGQMFERNNQGTATTNNTSAITVTSALASPDLQVFNLSVTPASLQSGGTLTVQWDDANRGTAATQGSWSDYITIKNETSGAVLRTDTISYDAAAQGNIAPNDSRTRQYTYQ